MVLRRGAAADGGEVASQSRGVTVTLLGTKYTVVSDRDEFYVRSLADYLNGKLEQFVPGRSMALLQRVILTALNIADELVRAREERDEALEEIERRSKELIASLDDGNEPSVATGTTSEEE